MNSESISLLLSFACLLLIPCAIVFGIATVGRGVFKKDWPSGKELFQTLATSIGITVAITLMICMVLKWTGFFDRQFYRPSSRDYGLAAELGLNPEEVRFASSDGTMLHGWFLSADDAIGTVIVFHGSDRNITDTVKNIHWFTRHGLNVFEFDYRGYGGSQGVPSRKGVVEDSVAAIDYVVGRSDVDKSQIVLFGQSMGGQLAINAASLRAETAIQLVISEATYAKHSYHIGDKIGRLGPLWSVKWGAWLVTGDDYCGEHAITQLTAPVLLVHGTSDTVVLPYHSDRLFAAAPQPKELWRYDGYGHLQIFIREDNQQRLGEYIRERLGAEPLHLDNASSGEQAL